MHKIFAAALVAWSVAAPVLAEQNLIFLPPDLQDAVKSGKTSCAAAVKASGGGNLEVICGIKAALSPINKIASQSPSASQIQPQYQAYALPEPIYTTRRQCEASMNCDRALAITTIYILYWRLERTRMGLSDQLDKPEAKDEAFKAITDAVRGAQPLPSGASKKLVEACKRQIPGLLLTPGTLKWVSAEATPATGYLYSINGKLDAQNANGALLRSGYNCLAKWNGKAASVSHVLVNERPLIRN